ncbi:glycosyltransferase family 2 protein [Streptococcus caprae]|uniref:Glycosyltransferase family 2 protein n=1 Tax=Streptococcus caprae TaxID=1640501 RepID=A0ABV8CTT7_9STRE
MTTISLVIPCYNEEGNIFEMLKACQQTFSACPAQIEYVFINDGSKDKTFSELQNLYQTYPNEQIKVINFSRNFGKEAAMYAGLQHATGEYTAIIDADLQQDPKYVLEMFNFLETNPDYDMVACYQKERRESALLKSFKRLFYVLMNAISEIEFIANASDFRMMRREVVDAILQLKESHRFSKGIFSWVGFETYYRPYEVKDRQHGQTSWSFRKLFSYALSGFVGFSTAPLKIATLLGASVSGVSFIYLFYTVWRWLVQGNDVPGFTTIVSLILFSSGLQMILIGILGEYLAHTFLQVKERPIYIVRDYLHRDKTLSTNPKN